MDIFLTILGIVVAAVGLNDIFHTLLHPSGTGRLSQWIAGGIWRISKKSGHRLGHIAGPAALLVVIAAWTLLQALGWALIYYPHIPEGVSYSPGIDPDRYNNFAEAFYISLVTLATLGYGDVVPVTAWVRLLSPVQALTGFALLTAALSWFNQIYPALGRRRTLAGRLNLLQDNAYAENLDHMEVSTGSRVLEDITGSIVQARVDITQNTETYYFRETDARISLAASLPYALILSAKAQDSPHEELRLNGRILQTALEDFAQHMKKQFSLQGESAEEIVNFFAIDHGHASEQDN